MWEVVDTSNYRKWRESLPKQHQGRIAYLQLLLAQTGPTLGRPHADTVSDSRHPNMKELRPTATLRVFWGRAEAHQYVPHAQPSRMLNDA